MGAVAMVAACLVAVLAVRQWRAVLGSGAMWVAWPMVAPTGHLAVFG